MNKLRIVFVSTDLLGGGGEIMLYRLLQKIDRSRFQPSVISLMGRERIGRAIESLGIPVYPLGLRQGTVTPVSSFRLVKLVRDARPHLIQGWMYHGNLAGQVAGLLLKRPVCWSIHSSFQPALFDKPLTRLTIRAAVLLSRRPAKIMYVSRASRWQHEKVGFASKRGCVIPNGIDSEAFKPSAEAHQSVRQELGLKPDTPLIGLMARFHPQKDHETFLRAAGILARQRRDVHFILAGSGVTKENTQLAKLLRDNRLSSEVHLLGERQDAARLTAALDISTLSSSFGEAFPLAIAEAMSCEVPCVVTDVGDSAFVVGETGVVVPTQNERALAEGWSRLLSLGSDGLRKLGKTARQRIEENFALTAIVKKYEDLYASLVPDVLEPTAAPADSYLLSVDPNA